MVQRHSGYTRRRRDHYVTPAWVVQALRPHLPQACTIWECAAGDGTMAAVMRSWGIAVRATDIANGIDFLQQRHCAELVIATNPPYGRQARDFIEHALALTRPQLGVVAMLLRANYDTIGTRQHLFGHCPQFAKRLVLTERIRWIPNSTGEPSDNHAWFLWGWRHRGPPILAYHNDQPARPRAFDIEAFNRMTKRRDDHAPLHHD